MCQKLQILSPNKIREMSYCSRRKINHLLLNNIDFMLNQIQSNPLKNHVNSIAITHWEPQFEYPSMKQKMSVLHGLKTVVLIFDTLEFKAIKSLFLIKINIKRMVSVKAIEYNYILN